MYKILIIEDEPNITKMLMRRLKKVGYSIEAAENGKIGVEKALQLNPDLILMDMHMPIMDGYTAAHTLRQQGYKGLISALTASAMVEITNKSIDAGCDTFISKPIGPDFEDKIKLLLTQNSKFDK